MRARVPLLILALSLMLGSCILGAFLERKSLLPAPLARLFLGSTPESPSGQTSEASFEEIDPVYTETHPAALISIRSAADVAELRHRLISYLWGEDGLPLDTLPEVDESIEGDRYRIPLLASAARIDRVTVRQDFGLHSTVHVFHPERNGGTLVLFHEGHQGDFLEHADVIGGLLNRGATVAAFCMPLLGVNDQPVVHLSRLGRLKLTSHEQMAFLEPKQGHPVKYFLEPVVVFLNHVTRTGGFEHVAMVGISGGGWTTTLAAALDPRIQTSFPVAGSYPFYLRSESRRDWGDFEQVVPELYRTANYLELYVMGAHGEGRRQLQVINKYDASCFAGVKARTYRDVTAECVRSLGAGSWDLFLDDTHRRHAISEAAFERILAELGLS
jgi:hypothetical protein